MIRSSILLLALLPACVSGAAQTLPADPDAHLEQDLAVFLTRQGYAQVPMVRLPTGHFSLTGTANTIPFDLIIDTGASHTLIDVERARRFDLETEDRGGRATGLGGSGQPVEAGRLDNVEIGALRFESIPVTVLDLSQVNRLLRSMGREPVDGIIGADVLMAQQAVIDYGSLSVYLKE
jgi:predicted aspartyl protease